MHNQESLKEDTPETEIQNPDRHTPAVLPLAREFSSHLSRELVHAARKQNFPTSRADLLRRLVAPSSSEPVIEERIPFPGRFTTLFRLALTRYLEELDDDPDIEVKSFDPRGWPEHLRYHTVSVDHDETASCLAVGTILVTSNDGRLVIRAAESHCSAWVSFFLPQSHEAWGREIIQGYEEAIEAHNPYKQKKVRMEETGIRFLPPLDLTWDDIVLPDRIRDQLERNLLFPLRHPDACRARGIEPRRSVLLSGVPGTGKTQLGRVLASLVPASFIWVTQACVSRSHHFSEVYFFARMLAPAVVFLEDLDITVGYRRYGVLGECLSQMDGFLPNDDIYVVATTNHPEEIDHALADRPGRFDRHLRIDPPSPEARELLLERFFGEEVPAARVLHHLREETEGFTGAHLKELVTTAKLMAAQKSIRSDGPAPIDRSILDVALRQLKRSRPEIRKAEKKRER